MNTRDSSAMDVHEGAAGCMRACMVHLESRDKLLKSLHHLGRNSAMATYEKIATREDDVFRRVRETGKVEDYMDYITYNKTSNYGLKRIRRQTQALA